MLVHNENALVPGYTKTKVSYFEDGETENPSKVFVCDMCEDFQTNTHYKLTMHKLRKHPKGNLYTICVVLKSCPFNSTVLRF